MNSSPRALYRAAWVLPVVTPPIRDGAVLVGDDGRIAAVGPAAALTPPPATPVVELGQALLLPGLVNVHAHAELSIFRGALEDLPFREWILRLVGAKRSALREDDELWAARWTAIEAIRAGVTTLGCTEASVGAVSALREAGLRGVVFQEVFGPDPAQAEESISALRACVLALRGGEDDLVRVGISPHAPYTVSDSLYRHAARLAAEEELPMALHIAESEEELQLVTRGGGAFQPGLAARGIPTPVRGVSPLEMLERLGVLRLRPLLIHAVSVDAADIRRIADSGSAVAHCAVANAKLGHGIAPIPEMRAAGIAVGIGTDSVGSNNRIDLLEEGRTASLLQRARLRSPDSLPAGELLRMCTVDGARALGLEARVGALRTGLEADLCAVSITAPHTRPVHDPVSTLFHSARGSDVVLTVVRGRVLYDGRRVKSMDEAEVSAAVDRIGERIGALR